VSENSIAMRSIPSSRFTLRTVALGVFVAAAACSIGIRRDYSHIPPGQVGFEDLCGLQDYFDTLEARQAEEPPLVSAVDIEGGAGKPVHGGKNRYAFETEFQLKHLRRVLGENWKNLPEPLASATRVEVEVHWSERSAVKRVVTDTDAELFIGRQSFALPYQVCLSELLYGAPLYRQRREMEGRQLPSRSLLGDAGIGNAPVGSPVEAEHRAPAAPVDAGSPDAGAARPAPSAPEARPVFKAAPPAR
jgi:hypothetical protein